MGYCVSVELHNVKIDFNKAAEALAAINALHDPDVMAKKAGGGYFVSGDIRRGWYRWVQNPPAGGFSSLEDALREWRYEASADNEHLCWLVDYFTGEKLGDDEYLWGALAPYMADGGCVIFRGEDGETWRYRFQGGRMFNETAQLVWVTEPASEQEVEAALEADLQGVPQLMLKEED